MIAERMAVVICLASLVVGGAAYGQNARPQIGIQLDPDPLPELLTKHLGLEPDQGIRVENVSLGSPADEIGLERDDIIVRFQGQDVTSVDEFIIAIRQAGVGATVSLETIHLGQRKTLEFELVPMEQNPQWKYPPEPEIVTSWRPGRFFRMGPNGESWMEIPFEKAPDVDIDVRRFLQERHTYHRSTDGEQYTITIEGDPQDEDSRVIVEAGDTEHSTTIGAIDKLPEKYRDDAREAIDSARRSSKIRLRVTRPELPEPPDPGKLRRYFENLNIPSPNLDRWSERQDRLLERIEAQMERLQERMERLEKRYEDPAGERREAPDEGDASGEPDPDVSGADPGDGTAV